MKVLVLNCGSSSIKYQLFDINDESHNVLAKGILERIGLEMGEFTHKWNGEKYYEQLPIPNHAQRFEPSMVICCGVRIPATTSSPCALMRYSPLKMFSPVAASRENATPVAEFSPMLPNTIA